jgi:hypothetical protein
MEALKHLKKKSSIRGKAQLLLSGKELPREYLRLFLFFS